MQAKHCPVANPTVIVLVVEKDADIRSALGNLLRNAGYDVTETENLCQAEKLIDVALEPLVLVIGDAGAVEEMGLRSFTMVAANPMTNHVYTYLSRTPERWRLPSLVETYLRAETSTADLPYELAALLAVVADATARACS